MFLFRQPQNVFNDVKPEDMQAMFKKWDDWKGGIAAQGKLVSHGNRLSREGKVLKSGGLITDGPFVEIREMLGGFIVVRADSFEEAVTLGHGCPALDNGGSVEVRSVVTVP